MIRNLCVFDFLTEQLQKNEAVYYEDDCGSNLYHCSGGGGIGIGYFSLPMLIERNTSDLRSEVRDLKDRLQKVEGFVKSEEEAYKVAKLSPDTNALQIIKTINNISSKVTSLEDSWKKDISAINDTATKQRTVTEETLEGQIETIGKTSKNLEARTPKITFHALMTGIRADALKVNYPAYKAGYLGQKNTIASASLRAAIHPRSQNGVFWQILIKLNL